ncbi:uncharacterized protein LOC144704637 [Wolffia australiana]
MLDPNIPHPPPHHHLKQQPQANEEDEDENQIKEEEEEEEEEEGVKQAWVLLAAGERRRTWAALFLAAYAALMAATWRHLRPSCWYESDAATWPWPEVRAAAALGGLFALLSLAAAVAVALPAMIVAWVVVLVLLACAGKSRPQLLRHGRRATVDIAATAAGLILHEGKLVVAACAAASLLSLLYRRHRRPD